MILNKLEKAGLIHPPKWMVASGSIQFLTVMGSTAYGTSSGASDLDIYGFCIPPKETIFPHLAGVIPGFGTQIEPFNQWQQHHIKSPDKDVEYDLCIYGIVKYFQLCMEGNPNMIDSLYVPRRCILHSTQIGERVREKRNLFLSKEMWHKFKGYSYSNFSKIKNKVNSANPKRAADIEAHGMDTKYAYNLVRLLGEIEQILVEQDLDIERNREQLKSIRRGEWTFERLADYFNEKEKALMTIYANSTLRTNPDEGAIKELLFECLEEYFGTFSQAAELSKALARSPSSNLLDELKALIAKY